MLFRLVVVLILLCIPSALRAEGLLWMVQELDGITGELRQRDGYLSYRTDRGEAVLRRLDNGQEMLRLAGDDESRVFHRDRVLYRLDGDGRFRLHYLDGRPAETLPLKVDPGPEPALRGEELLFLDASGSVCLLDLTENVVRHRFTPPDFVRGLALLSDGRLAAWGDGQIWLQDRTGGQTETRRGRVRAADGGYLLQEGEGRTLVLPEIGGLPARSWQGLRASGGRLLFWDESTLAVVDGDTLLFTGRFPERIADAAWNGLKPLLLFRDWSVEEWNGASFVRERRLECGFGSDRIYATDEGILLRRGGRLAACGREGVHPFGPRERIERTGSVFGTAYSELRSERWQFAAVAWGGGGAWLLARPGEGGQRLLRYEGMGRPLVEICRLEGDWTDLVAEGLGVLLWDRRQARWGRWQNGSLETMVTDAPLDRIFSFAGDRFGLEDGGGLRRLDGSGSWEIPQGVTAAAVWPVGQEEWLALRLQDGSGEVRFRLLDSQGAVQGEFSAGDRQGALAGSPGEAALIYTAAAGSRLEYRRLGMAGARIISDFGAGRYRIERLALHQSGLLGFFTMQIPEREHQMLAVFSPRGQIVRPIGLEEGMCGIDFAGRSSRLIVVGRQEEMGILRIYSLDGDPKDL